MSENQNNDITSKMEMAQQQHHHRKHHRRFTKPMLFTWILLLLLCVCYAAAIIYVPQINMTLTIVCVAVLLVLLVVTGIFTFRKYHHKGRRIIIAVNSVLSALFILIGVTGVLMLKDVSPLKQSASLMKSDLKTTIEYVKNEDIANARSSITTLDNDVDSIQSILNKPTWTIAQYIPVVGNQVKSVKDVVDAVDTASSQILTPFVDLLETQPLSSLKVDDGFNVNVINSYLSFVEGIYPTIKDMNKTIQNADLSLTGMQDQMDEYKGTLDAFVSGYDKYVPAIKAFLGDGSYREYMFMAQNLAEGRSMGGFAGSMAIITVQDGILRLGDFAKIYDYMSTGSIPESVYPTEQEYAIFGDYVGNSRDANYNPDFARAAQIWTGSYEIHHPEVYENGLVSLTPTVIQKILSVFETNITLSDGTVLDGSNTMRVLSHDLYYKYLGYGAASEYNDLCDALFAETASQAMDIMISNFSFSNIQKYMDIMSDSIEDGTFCVWMKDATEESYMVTAGVDGQLNNGTTNNVAGLYWNFDVANKMGWFLNLDTSVSEGVKNEDGTYSYTVTATITNIFTDADYEGAGEYILGTYNGNLDGLLYLFAPNGGSISNISTDNGIEFAEDNYEGLQVFYNKDVVIAPQTSMTVTYTVTTGSGVSDPLVLRKTPTLTNYR